MSDLSRKLFYSLPPKLRFSARRLFYLPIDIIEKILGQRDALIPPRGLIYTGGGDFKKIGEMQLAYFQEYCNLQPAGNILDIGSGMGRSAVALTQYLNGQGKYEGFDVVKRGVDWCKKTIASRYPNFNFKYIPLNNDLYRPDGEAPEKFQFAYPDNSFDLIIVNSVFTHMVADEVENYFNEMSRVLKREGHVYATFFIFEKNKTIFPKGFDFPFDYKNYRLMDDEVKSANVAYQREYLLNELAGKNNFIVKHVFEGSWKGLPKERCKEFQDLIIFKKG